MKIKLVALTAIYSLYSNILWSWWRNSKLL